MNRREFLHKGAMAAAASAAGSTALSYGRIHGANERISIGHIGIGTRGKELDGMTAGTQDFQKRGDDSRL